MSEKKVKLKYVGTKAKYSFFIPIGCKSRGAISKTFTVSRGDEVELFLDDAKKLMELKDHKFEFVSGDGAPVGRPKKIAQVAEEAVA